MMAGQATEAVSFPSVMAHRIVFLDRSTLKAPLRRPTFEHHWVEYATTPVDAVVERLRGAQVAISNKVPLRADALAQLPELELIAVSATGYDQIDLTACRAQGIVVSNIRHYATHAVPEHVFALVLALRRNLLAYRADVERGRWQDSPQFCFVDHPILDLHGATLGIIGDGALGRATARLGEAFGMRVLFAEHGAVRPGAAYATMDRLLECADVVSLHCPLTPDTLHFIGLEQLRRMKRSALLINTARGGLVNEADLVVALEHGLIAGAGFDVLSAEPPKDGNPLLDLRRPNFILTPHVAWASEGARQALADQLIANIEAYIRGTPVNVVT